MTAERRRLAVAGALLLALAFVLFGMTLGTDLYFDDAAFIRFQDFFRRPAGEAYPALFSRGYFAATGERTYQPLASALNRFLFHNLGLARVLGVTFHAGVAFLLGLLARRLTGRELAGAAAGVLFLLHPAASETVFFLSFRGHLLGAASVLACVLCFAAWDDDVPYLQKGLSLSLIFMAAGLAAKETALLGPALAGVYAALLGRRPRAESARALAPHAALAAAYLVWRFLILIPPPSSLHPAPWTPLTTAGWIPVKAFWPAPLCLTRPVPSTAWACGVPLWAAALWLCRARPCARFGLLWAGAATAPYLFPFGAYAPVADRYLYLAAAGAALTLADVLSEGRARLALAALVLAWGGQLTRRNGDLRDEVRIAEATVACAPEHPQAYALRGFTRLLQGKPRAAVEDYRTAGQLAPWDIRLADGLRMAGAAARDAAAVAEGTARSKKIREGL